MLRVVARGACRRFCAPGSGQFSGRRPRIGHVWKTQFSNSAPAPTTPPEPTPGTEARRLVDFLIDLAMKYKRLKVIGFVAAGLVYLVASDTCFLVWNLYHPEFPDFFKPVLHVDTSEAEDEILELMNGEPQFMLLYGIPGCGKTTTVLSAARRRGRGVMYYSVGNADSLQPFVDYIQKKFGVPLPGIRELLGWTSGKTIWDRLTVAGKVWRKWCSKEDPARSLVIILDNANKLKKEDLYKLANVGKEAKDGSSFSLWLVSSKVQGMEMLRHLSDAMTRIEGINLSPVSEEKLVDMAKRVLGGDPRAADLAERFVYLTGTSMAILWKLLTAVRRNAANETGVKSRIRDLFIQSRPPLDNQEKEFLKLVLASGKGGADKKEMRSPINWTCLQPDMGSVKLRSRYCRDLVAFWVADAEATAANAAATAADAAATAADAAATAAARDAFSGKLIWWRVRKTDDELATIMKSYQAAKDKAKAAEDAAVAARDVAARYVAARDAAAEAVSNNQLGIDLAASRYLSGKE